MMSKWIVAVAAAALVGGASLASAGEPAGHVGSSQLQALGLGGLKPISDAEGHQVRGKFLGGLLAGLFGGGGGGNNQPILVNGQFNTFEGINIEGDENFSNFGGNGVGFFGGGNEFGPGSFGGAFGGLFTGPGN
jgi:hypothetical protein